MNATPDREAIGELPNPLGLDGIEFIEYATSRPQALGQVLETMGFRPIARHRSREVLLYRQGDMNVVVNAHASAGPARVRPAETPRHRGRSALRVRDAAAAYRRALDRGAWAVPMQVEVMELQHPGDPRRRRQPHLLRRPLPKTSRSTTSTSCPSPPSTSTRPPLAGLHWFGIVQYIGTDRMDDWMRVLPRAVRLRRRCPTSSASASCPRAAS